MDEPEVRYYVGYVGDIYRLIKNSEGRWEVIFKNGTIGHVHPAHAFVIEAHTNYWDAYAESIRRKAKQQRSA